MKLDFEKQGGMVPAVVQDARTGEVLMLGYMNPAAWEETLRSGQVTFFSRSKGRLWKKGEESGHTLELKELRVDCDLDTVLARVEPKGPGVCHEGYQSCFFRRAEGAENFTVVEERTYDPAVVYAKEKKR